jgi:hypothetical protein
MTLAPHAYPIDELLIPWGRSLAEVAATLPDSRLKQPPGYREWPELHGACRSAFGLAATAYQLRAPSLHKPVLAVRYHLAPPPSHPQLPPDPAYWLAPLAQLLGPPTGASPAATNGGDYRASWQQPAVCLSLLARGGPGPSTAPAASLLLEWRDLAAAAQPFYEAGQAQAAVLAMALTQVTELRIFSLQEPQHDYSGRPADWVPPAGPTAPAPWQVQQALYLTGLVETPAALQAQLSPRQVALWQVPGQAAWAVSTPACSILLNSPAGPRVELLTVRPAKGGGEMRLYVGDLVLYDTYHSPALGQLAAALEGQAGSTVNRLETHDC